MCQTQPTAPTTTGGLRSTWLPGARSPGPNLNASWIPFRAAFDSSHKLPSD